MRKGLFFTLILAFLIGGCSKTGNEIHIGAILPLTGGAAQWGVPARNGVMLAVDQINADGGINGKKIALDLQDDQCDPTKGVSAVQNLISTNKPVAIVGAVCSSVSLAIAPILEKDKVIMISPASTSPLLSNAGNYIFRDISTDKLRADVFAQYIMSLGIKSLSILYINNDGGVGATDAFVQEYQKLGGVVRFKDAYQQGQTEFRSEVAKAKRASAEAVMIVSYPSDTSILLRELKQLNFKGKIFALTEALDDPTVVKAAGNAANGVVYIVPAPAEGQQATEFAKQYKAEYGSEPPLYSAEAFDAVYLLKKVCAEVPDLDPAKLADSLHAVSGYKGASGSITFQKSGDVIKPMAIMKIADGKPLMLELR